MSYVTEIVWRLGFADVAFRVERSDDREHVCDRIVRYLSLYETFTFQSQTRSQCSLLVRVPWNEKRRLGTRLTSDGKKNVHFSN